MMDRLDVAPVDHCSFAVLALFAPLSALIATSTRRPWVRFLFPSCLMLSIIMLQQHWFIGAERMTSFGHVTFFSQFPFLFLLLFPLSSLFLWFTLRCFLSA